MRAKFTLSLLLMISILSTGLRAQTIYALESGNNNLVKFPVSDPSLTSTVAITGVSLLGPLVAIDFRPATGELFALGYNSVLTEVQLYTIDTLTGEATTVGSPLDLNIASASNVAFDFNPTVDRIRLITSVDSNYRLNPLNGQLAATDGIISYAAGDVNAGADPDVMAVAYTNSYGSATTTMLYAYDLEADVLVTINPANSGTMQTVGSSGRNFEMVDIDIAADNMAFLVGHESGEPDSLYMLNLTNGTVTAVRDIGTGLAIQDIAVWISGDAPVGILSVENSMDVSIFPNPATDRVLVELGDASVNTTVSLTDVSGKLVYQGILQPHSQSVSIDMASFAPGMYYLAVQNENGRVVKAIGKH